MVVLPGVFSPPVLTVRVWPAATWCRRRSDSGQLIYPAGKTTAVQEVSSRGPGHVTAAAAERHVGAPGGGAERARKEKERTKGKEREEEERRGKERKEQKERKGNNKSKRKGKNKRKGKEKERTGKNGRRN